jgi:hypothetical protein
MGLQWITFYVHPFITNPLITITIGVRGAIQKHSIEKLNSLKIPKANIKTLMKSLHNRDIKYLTYLILNKRKLDNKQTPVPPPQQNWMKKTTLEPTS